MGVTENWYYSAIRLIGRRCPESRFIMNLSDSLVYQYKSEITSALCILGHSYNRGLYKRRMIECSIDDAKLAKVT